MSDRKYILSVHSKNVRKRLNTVFNRNGAFNV